MNKQELFKILEQKKSVWLLEKNLKNQKYSLGNG